MIQAESLQGLLMSFARQKPLGVTCEIPGPFYEDDLDGHQPIVGNHSQGFDALFLDFSSVRAIFHSLCFVGGNPDRTRSCLRLLQNSGIAANKHQK